MSTGVAGPHGDGARRSRTPSRVPIVAGLLVALLLVVAACSGVDGVSAGSKPTTAATEKVTGTITVSAAASLKDAFTRIARDFESAHPGTEVVVNFGSSGDLASQIATGAPVDVAAFAAESNMTTLADAHLLDGTPEVFATNRLVVVTKPGNPERVAGLADLAAVARGGGTVSLCAETAPCGQYADQVLRHVGVSIPTDRITRGQDVRATLAAVTDGDADAGLVYVTDAAAVGPEVTTVTIPAEQNAVARYPIAVVKATTNRPAASAFLRDLLGGAAQKVLRDAGFGPP